MKHWPSILIITISALLMQWHSIAFWFKYAGNTGVGFSLALEVVALWLWWQRHTGLAVLASVLLISGSLFQLSSPVFETITKNKTNSNLISSYKNEITQLSNSLIQYDANSSKRIGWSSRIDRAQEDLSKARDGLRVLLSVKTTETPVRLYLIVLMQTLALIVIMRSQIIAVKSLPLVTTSECKQIKRVRRQGNNEIIPNNEKEITRKSARNSFDERVHIVATKMKKHLSDKNIKQNKLAEDIGVRPADVSMIFNHNEIVNKGNKVVSEPALIKMEKAMEEV